MPTTTRQKREREIEREQKIHAARTQRNYTQLYAQSFSLIVAQLKKIIAQHSMLSAEAKYSEKTRIYFKIKIN